MNLNEVYEKYNVSDELFIEIEKLIMLDVKRTVFNLTEEDMKDLVQDVLIQVYRYIPKYDPSKASFSTYIYNLIRKKKINELKHKRYYKTYCNTFINETIYNNDNEDGYIDNTPSTVDSYIFETVDYLNKIKANKRTRKIISYLLKGYIQKEIKEEMDCSKQLVSRCINNFRKSFNEL